ncbi:hypothetical protein ATER59S_01039 [Aquamicrobium terrae]
MQHIVVFATERIALKDLGHVLNGCFKRLKPVALVFRDPNEAQNPNFIARGLGVNVE